MRRKPPKPPTIARVIDVTGETVYEGRAIPRGVPDPIPPHRNAAGGRATFGAELAATVIQRIARRPELAGQIGDVARAIVVGRAMTEAVKESGRAKGSTGQRIARGAVAGVRHYLEAVEGPPRRRVDRR